MRAANAAIHSSGADLAIFTCDPALCDFYVQGGWSVMADSYLVGGTREQPVLSSDLGTGGKVVMLDAISALAEEHLADFAAARIELYPGPIDKLW